MGEGGERELGKVVSFSDARDAARFQKIDEIAQEFLEFTNTLHESRQGFFTALDELDESLRRALPLARQDPTTKDIVGTEAFEIANNMSSCREILDDKSDRGSMYARWLTFMSHMGSIALSLEHILLGGAASPPHVNHEKTNTITNLRQVFASLKAPSEVQKALEVASRHLDAIEKFDSVLTTVYAQINMRIQMGVAEISRNAASSTPEGVTLMGEIGDELKKARDALESEESTRGSFNDRLNRFDEHMGDAIEKYLSLLGKVK